MTKPKKPVITVTEQILITAVVNYNWTKGKQAAADHDLHNELLYRIKKAVHDDYPLSRFHIMSLNVKVNKK